MCWYLIWSSLKYLCAFSGIDDAPSECDLDDFVEWDLVVQNNKSDNCQGYIDEIVNQAFKA